MQFFWVFYQISGEHSLSLSPDSFTHAVSIAAHLHFFLVHYLLNNVCSLLFFFQFFSPLLVSKLISLSILLLMSRTKAIFLLFIERANFFFCQGLQIEKEIEKNFFLPCSFQSCKSISCCSWCSSPTSNGQY